MNQKLVTAVEKECDHFLANHTESLPRIAWRYMQPILVALAALYQDIAKGGGRETPIPLFQYRVDAATNRRNDAPVGEYHIANVAYSPERSALLWKLTPAGEDTVDMVVTLSLALLMPGWRVISLEDLLELGVQPIELVRYMRNTAGTLSFTAAVEKATQPPARA